MVARSPRERTKRKVMVTKTIMIEVESKSEAAANAAVTELAQALHHVGDPLHEAVARACRVTGKPVERVQMSVYYEKLVLGLVMRPVRKFTPWWDNKLK